MADTLTSLLVKMILCLTQLGLIQSMSNEIRSVEDSCPARCVCYATVARCMFLKMKNVPRVDSSLTVIDLRFNKIQKIEDKEFAQASNLTTLLLNNNRIKRIRKKSFRGLDNLRQLHLHKNHIEHIDSHAFYDLKNLHHLYLQYNRLKHISHMTFQGLLKLERVFLQHNKIQFLATRTFKDLRNLQRLRLDGNLLPCGCQLSWLEAFKKWHSAKKSFEMSATCQIRTTDGPQDVDISEADLSCDDFYFTEEPSDTTVALLGSFRFHCQVHNGANVSFSWLKNGRPVEDNSSHRVKMTPDNSTLLISRVTETDAGLYQCMAQKADRRIISRQARLRLLWNRRKPKITFRPEFTEVHKGERIVLQCGATGFPRPYFAWYKDGGRLSNAHDRFEILDNGTLIISNAQLDDTAHYRCSATNYLGRASSAARVKVNLNIPQVAPTFTSRPRDARSREGGIVEFTCIAEGQPYPDITWWNNNRIVNSDGRVTVSNGGQHLRLTDLRVHDSGEYTCRAENELGRDEVRASLEVVAQSRPPAFTVQPHDMTAPLSSTVQIPCQAEGYPVPVISWHHNGVPMSSRAADGHYTIYPDGSLVIYNVSRNDEGVYECIADNGREKRTVKANFSIVGSLWHSNSDQSEYEALADKEDTAIIIPTLA